MKRCRFCCKPCSLVAGIVCLTAAAHDSEPHLLLGVAPADAAPTLGRASQVNGAWSCENPTTLAQDLKRTLGFQGYVMSDWGATHSASIMQGLDMEQATQTYMNGQVLNLALDAGNVSQAAIDDSVARILWSMLSTGVMDEPLSTWDRRRTSKGTSHLRPRGPLLAASRPRRRSC
ncbi:unnamed protein product [Prorocentrum cordatum]|uniref:beta-glucosidase n=1 Tax=Prorocentrum cordatum TaxID=2364126 RepID=A0ABN9V8Z8_9DINO|nr:unnamed protein product [Polarella glacialis]